MSNKPTELMMYTTEEGGDWHFVQAHSIVVDGMRWDMRSRIWAKCKESVNEVWKYTIERIRNEP